MFTCVVNLKVLDLSLTGKPIRAKIKVLLQTRHWLTINDDEVNAK
jgi:hypothetical protein